MSSFHGTIPVHNYSSAYSLIIHRFFPNEKSGKQAQKIQRSDFALLGCLWWPNVDLDALRLLTHLALWYLVWDDEMESKYLGVEGDLTAADKFRSQTRTVIAMSLGLADEDRAIIEGAPHLIQQFYPLGGRIRSQISQGQSQV